MWHWLILEQLRQMERRFMLSLEAIKAQVATLTTKVNDATTRDAATSTLISGLVQVNKDLQAQVASMSAETITQADIDALAAQIGDQATALDQATSGLVAAIPANTTG